MPTRQALAALAERDYRRKGHRINHWQPPLKSFRYLGESSFCYLRSLLKKRETRELLSTIKISKPPPTPLTFIE